MSILSPRSDPSSFSLSDQGLSEIPCIEYPKGIELLDLSRNPIENLKNLKKIPTLTKIICEDSAIFSFKGAVDEPRLSFISFKGCPITILPQYRIMASIVFGRSVEVVDGDSLSVSELSIRDKYGPVIKRYLVSGYCLMDLDPITLYNFEEKKQKIVDLGPIGNSLDDLKKDDNEENKKIDNIISEIANHSKEKKKNGRSKNKNVIPKTYQEKLVYHGDTLKALGATKKNLQMPLPFPPYGYV